MAQSIPNRRTPAFRFRGSSNAGAQKAAMYTPGTRVCDEMNTVAAARTAETAASVSRMVPAKTMRRECNTYTESNAAEAVSQNPSPNQVRAIP